MKIAKATVITHTESEDFDETITIKIHDGESVVDAVNRVYDEFNAEEIRRSEAYTRYPCAETRSLNAIISVDMLDNEYTADWNKLAEYFDNRTVFQCKNSGLFAVADWWPSELTIGKYVCKICNSHFKTELEYQEHFNEYKHKYCEVRQDTHRVYFSKELDRYLSRKEEERAEALRENDKKKRKSSK